MDEGGALVLALILGIFGTISYLVKRDYDFSAEAIKAGYQQIVVPGRESPIWQKIQQDPDATYREQQSLRYKR